MGNYSKIINTFSFSRWCKFPKIDVAKDWAKALGINDPSGIKMKIHVNQVLEKYKKAYYPSKSTGFGDKIKKVKVKGKIIEEVVTALSQLKAICPIYEILNEFLEGDIMK